MDPLVEALRITSIATLIVAIGWLSVTRFPRLVARFVEIRRK